MSNKEIIDKENNKNNKENKTFIERRVGPNFWVKFVKFFSILDWVLIAAILLIFDSAMPKAETFFDRIFNVKRYNVWDFKNFRILFSFVILLFIGSGLALLANIKKLRRKDDKINISNLIAFLFSGISIFIYALYFF